MIRTGRKLCLAVGIMTLGVMAGCVAAPRGLAAGDEAAGPWWMQQTALTRDGKLDLKSKPWWNDAKSLPLNGRKRIEVPGGPNRWMLIRHEIAQRRTGPVDAIVWIIDDDGDMCRNPKLPPGTMAGLAPAAGDTDSDCYVVDYGCDGVVDPWGLHRRRRDNDPRRMAALLRNAISAPSGAPGTRRRLEDEDLTATVLRRFLQDDPYATA